MDVSANLPALPGEPGSPGVVVVQTGRLAGTRRHLRRPMTLLGLSHSCDVRIQGEGVAPLHCVLVHDDAGPIVRDLGGGVRVNGELVDTHRLGNGDVIELGEVQLLLELETPPTSENPNADAVLLKRERDAVRVQVAAVAAQQAALTEEEAALDQRATTLDRQETQLAGHLEERQQELDGREAELRDRHTEAQAAREAIDQQAAGVVQKQAEADQQHQQARLERQRLNDLRRRLWKRYQRHWDAREAALKRREADLGGREQQLERQRDAVRAFQERLNGELELGRRKLREEAQEVALAQQRWHEGVEAQRQDHARRQAELDLRASEVANAEAAQAAEQARGQQRLDHLGREAAGLEARVRNLRGQLGAQQGQPMAAAVVPPAMAPALQALAAGPLPERLRELAGMLGDQRLHLAEQWHRLVELLLLYHNEQTDAQRAIEAAGDQLARREREVTLAEQRLQHAREELDRRGNDLAHARYVLEASQARFTLSKADWQARADAADHRLTDREQALATRLDALDVVSARFEGQLSDELTQLQASRARCEEARRQFSQLWQECETLREALAEQERELTAESLAVERLRSELVHTAPNSVKAEGRVEKLRQRELHRLDRETKALVAERDRLFAERASLDAEGKRLGQVEEGMLAWKREWAKQLAAADQQRLDADDDEATRQRELSQLRLQITLQERQLRQLRDEIERLVRALLEDAPEPAAQQAA